MSHEHVNHISEECADFIERIVQLIDGELDDADCAVVRIHLDGCAPCLESYEGQALVKALVARSCAERAPSHLRERIQISLTQTTTWRIEN